MTETATPTIYATLLKGDFFTLSSKEPGKSKRFEKNVAQKVSAEEKAYLEANALEQVQIGSGEDVDFENRPKFSFSETAAPVRKRA